MSKSPESRKRNAARNHQREIESIRRFVYDERNGCPDMSRADGMKLFEEIDRLTAEVERLTRGAS
jgi:hypothetical protein